MNIKIDRRLLDIANLVPSNTFIADIGTDHGYLPIYLVLNNIVKKAIASDVATSPLNSCIENIKKYQLENKIDTILSNGFENISEDVDVVILAGMGGELIIDLLKNTTKIFDTYIFEANNNNYKLRDYLSKNNFIIVDETISKVKNKYYEIIKAKKGNQLLDEVEKQFGPINIKKKNDLFIEYLNNKLNNYQKIIASFNGNENDYNKIINAINTINKLIN